MGKSTISMAIFNSYVSHYQRVWKLSSSHGNPSISTDAKWPGFQETWERYIDGLLVCQLSGGRMPLEKNDGRLGKVDDMNHYQMIYSHDIISHDGSMYYFFLYMVTFTYINHQYIPVMLAYISAPWILWILYPEDPCMEYLPTLTPKVT